VLEHGSLITSNACSVLVLSTRAESNLRRSPEIHQKNVFRLRGLQRTPGRRVGVHALVWKHDYLINMSVQLLGKRELKRLASVANDGAGAG